MQRDDDIKNARAKALASALMPFAELEIAATEGEVSRAAVAVARLASHGFAVRLVSPEYQDLQDAIDAEVQGDPSLRELAGAVVHG